MVYLDVRPDEEPRCGAPTKRGHPCRNLLFPQGFWFDEVAIEAPDGRYDLAWMIDDTDFEQLTSGRCHLHRDT